MSDAPTITVTRDQAQRMCFGKRAFGSVEHAGRVLVWLRRRLESQGKRFDPQRIYRCPICGQFHTTSRREMDVPQVG